MASASSLSAITAAERGAWKLRLILAAVLGMILGSLLGAAAFGSLSSDSTATAFIRITQPVDFTAVAGGASQTTPNSQDITENYVAGEVAFISGEGFAHTLARKLAKSKPASIIVSQAGGSSVVTISNSSSSADEARRTVQAAIDIYGQQLAQRVDAQMRAILPALDRWQMADASDTQRMAEISALREAIVLQGAQASVVDVLQPPAVADPGVDRWLIGALLGGVLGAALAVLVVMRRTGRSGRPNLVPLISEAVDGVLAPAVNLRTARSPKQASLARTLYTQCVAAAAADGAIVLLGLSEESGSPAMATMFEFAAAECGSAMRIEDAGAVGQSPAYQAIERASVVVIVARFDHDTAAQAVAACAGTAAGNAPVLAVFTYRPWWDSWLTFLKRAGRGARTNTSHRHAAAPSGPP